MTNTYMWNTLFLNRYVSRGYFSFFAGVLLADYFERVRKNRCELASLMLPVIFLGLLKTKPHFLETGDFLFLYPYVVDSCLDLSNEMDTKSKKRM